MPRDFDTRFLRGLVGTKVTIFDDIDPTQGPSGNAWIITEKLSEEAVYLTKEIFENGVGVSLTAGVFLYYLEEDPAQVAFMRIYYQIPVTGTEDDPATLVQQVIGPKVCSEREAFKQLMAQNCTAVPRYFGYGDKKQGQHDLDPGGYIK